jgi:ribosomal protein S18 acetylase RimI-like enzyme
MEAPTNVRIRLATPGDIPVIDYLDSLSSSPTRDIHREVEKYFGSVDPSTHEKTFIFLAETENQVMGKVELMVPPHATSAATGYIKRVIVHPDWRGQGIARHLLNHTTTFARQELQLGGLDLHVWEGNQGAIRLYQDLGFQMQHRELYFRLNLAE